MAIIADRGRVIQDRLGFRPYRAFLVWQRWTGDERGEGVREVICRHEIHPTPKVDDLTGISKAKGGSGRFGQGSLRVSEISARYTHEQLSGIVVPDAPELEVPHPYEFFWEIVEDERHGPAPVRRKFGLSSEPSYSADESGWSLMLERSSDDADRDGNPVDGPVEPKRDPMVAVRPDDPDDDL